MRHRTCPGIAFLTASLLCVALWLSFFRWLGLL
jgi:hypothetical protein